MPEREYILFCDESDKYGEYYSHFYGGLIVGASQYMRVTQRLNDTKRRLNINGEVKWQKVAQAYLPKYTELIHSFFEEVAAGHVRVRVMFHQNARKAKRLTLEQVANSYYLLYYQFIKHAFGLQHVPVDPEGMPTHLRLYFDQFPDTGEQVERFKGFIHGLQMSVPFRNASICIRREDITEVRSHDHVLLQCLDVVLGAMSFRLNNKHKEMPPGQKRRGARTRAKESLPRDPRMHPGESPALQHRRNHRPQARAAEPLARSVSTLGIPAE